VYTVFKSFLIAFTSNLGLISPFRAALPFLPEGENIPEA